MYTRQSDARVNQMKPSSCTSNYIYILHIILHRTMNEAVAHCILHPQESYERIGETFNISGSTLHDRITGAHAPRGVHGLCNLSIIQESALSNKSMPTHLEGPSSHHTISLYWPNGYAVTLLGLIGHPHFCTGINRR